MKQTRVLLALIFLLGCTKDHSVITGNNNAQSTTAVTCQCHFQYQAGPGGRDTTENITVQPIQGVAQDTLCGWEVIVLKSVYGSSDPISCTQL